LIVLTPAAAGFEAMAFVPQLFLLITIFHSGASPTATSISSLNVKPV
jgi:hypothetical protein